MDVNQLIKFIKPIAEYKIGTDKVLENRGTKPKSKKCIAFELNEFGEPEEIPEELPAPLNGYLVVTKWLHEQPENMCGHFSKMAYQRTLEGWKPYCQKCGRERWAKLNKIATTLAQQADL